MINEQDEITNLDQGSEKSVTPEGENADGTASQNSEQNKVEEEELTKPAAENEKPSELEVQKSEEAKKVLQVDESNEPAMVDDKSGQTEHQSEVKEESKAEETDKEQKDTVKPTVAAAASAVAKPKIKKSAKAGEKKWYVVRAISGKENKVKLYIEQEINRLGLSDYVSQVLIPKEKIYQIKAGKKVSKERNYFPGYVLVEANLVGEIPHIIESTTGVIGFLGSKGQPPAPLRASEVNRILGKVDELAESEEMINVPYVVGETVKVTDGPFNSFSGIIEEVNEEKKKLKVMVKIFGRKTPLELGYLQVEKE